MTASYHELASEENKELEGRKERQMCWPWEKITDHLNIT
jgi:hypothetical protein